MVNNKRIRALVLEHSAILLTCIKAIIGLFDRVGGNRNL